MITLLILVFPTVSGAIIVVFKLSEMQGRVTQAMAFLIAGILGYIISRLRFGNFKSVFIYNKGRFLPRDYIWFIPVIFAEMLPFISGLKEELIFGEVVIIFLFTASVGFTEELYFRGLIAKSMIEKSMPLTIILSSFLFSVGHFLNLLTGAGLIDTLLQVVFAFIFGIVALEISIVTGNIGIAIIWHWAHNFISLLTTSNDGERSFYIEIIQGIILILYGLFLWRKLDGVKYEYHNERTHS